MLLRQMKYFLAVADCKSFSEAAAQCFISQSAISQQIKALEDELAAELILRSNRRFTLTPAGEFFYRKAREIVGETQKLKNTVYQMQHSSDRQIRLGYLNNYNVARLSCALAALLDEEKNLNVSVAYGAHDELMHKLLRGELDAALSDLRSEAEANNFICQPVEETEVLVAVSRKNTLFPPHSDLEVLEPADIEKLQVIIVADKDCQEQEKSFYRQFLNFSGSFLTARDLPSAVALLISGKGCLPIFGSGEARDFIAKFAKLYPLYQNGQPLRVKYCAFWPKGPGSHFTERVVSRLLDLQKSVSSPLD